VRAKVKLHLKIIRWPLVLLFYTAVLLCIRNPIRGEFIPLGLTRGEVRGEVDYIAFSRWLLMMAAPVLVNGWYLERVSRIEIFVRLRMRGLSLYRLFLLCGCMANSAVWALFLSAVVLRSLGYAAAGRQLLLMLPNLLMWACLTAALFIRMKRAPWTGVLCIGIVGGTFLLGGHIPGAEKFMPAIWGMLCRSSYWGEGGIPAGYMVLMSVFLGLVLIAITSPPPLNFGKGVQTNGNHHNK